MVGSRGKGSRSKSKGLAPGPVVPEPLKISFDGTSGSPLDGEDDKTDSLNTIVMPLKEEQMDEMISGFIFSDELEDKDQNVQHVSVATEMNVGRTEDVCTQEGTIKDVNGVIDGSDPTADVSVQVNEEIRINPEEDEAGKSDKKTEDESLANSNYSCLGDESKSLEVATEDGPTDAEGRSSFDHGVKETMIDNLENLEEPIKLDTEKSLGTLSDIEDEEHKEEDPSIDNEVKEVARKVIGPKRKIGKKKVVKRKVIVRRPVAEAEKNDKKTEEDEAPVEVGLDSDGTGTGDEGKSLEATTVGVPTDTEGLSSFDHGIQKTMVDNLENLEEPVRPDTEKPIGTLSDNVEEGNMEGNTSIANDVKEVTGQVNRPKRIVKKKLVKKKKLRKLAAVNEEVSQSLNENNASDEACKVDMDEHVNNEAPSDDACKEVANDQVNNAERTEVKSPVKANKKRNNNRKRKALQGDSSTATVKDAHKLQSEKVEPRIGNHIEINEPDVKNGEVAKSADRASLSKKNKKKNVAKNGTQDGGVSNDASKPKPSKEGKSSKKIDSMGMIFMCSSETKKDCYRYKVLGLPAGKKDMVMKIYKGMRLFLFDVDLRMMYGVYKAADPGGYNIEPRAFKSQFPSQVRFSILEDCVPLAEERFKKVLKDNYYTKNKFNCQLNSKQVKDLCKLFRETNRKAEPQKVDASRRPAATHSARRDKKRKRVDDSRRGAGAPVERERSWQRVQEEPRRAPVVIDDRSRRRVRQDIVRHAPVVIDDRSWRRAQEEARHASIVIDDRSGRRAQEEIRHAPVAMDDSLDRYHRHPVYERETYLSSLTPVTSYQPLPALSPPRSRMYSFDRTLSIDPYRRDSFLGHRDLGHSSSQESRLAIGLSQHDLNLSYREPHVYSAPVYSTDTRREHYDYLPDRPYAEHYTTAEHRPPPPLYRRY